jgi:hypothetical protein
MPAKTKPTPKHVVEILAADGMGWRKSIRGGRTVWYVDEIRYVTSPHDFDPLADLNAIYKIEARLTDEQWDEYLHQLHHQGNCLTFRSIRHADARTCAYALARVFKPEEEF